MYDLSPLISNVSIRHLLNHGVLVVQLPVFLVFPVEVHLVQVKEPSVTCAEVVVCSVRLRSGVVGIERSV
jgi:hypothetical protein